MRKWGASVDRSTILSKKELVFDWESLFVLARHSIPQPESCEVCRYSDDHETDHESEHALTRLATIMIVEALREAGGSSHMQSLATSWDIGVGPVHVIEPRHWHWSLFFERSLRIQLVEVSHGQ